jgi:hypothetical protein
MIAGVDVDTGVALGARIRDTTMIEMAIETQLENMEVIVGLWDEAATDDDAICKLEKITGLSRRQINRWRTSQNDDRRRCKLASDLLVVTYASVLGLTRCQARAELCRIGNGLRAIAEAP